MLPSTCVFQYSDLLEDALPCTAVKQLSVFHSQFCHRAAETLGETKWKDLGVTFRFAGVRWGEAEGN